MIPPSHFKMAHGEGEQGGRAVFGEQVDLETRPRPGPGAQIAANSGELCRVSRAMTHDRGASAPLAWRDVIGQPAGTLGDRPLVEDVGADRVHLAPTAAGAELEDGVEGVVEHLPVGRPRCPRPAGRDRRRTAAR